MKYFNLLLAVYLLLTGCSQERIEAEKAAAFEAEEVAKIDMSRKRNFRDTYWGMTVHQVKASEKWLLVKFYSPTMSFLPYEGEIFNTKCSLIYSVGDGEELSLAYYVFSDLKKEDAHALRVLIGTIMAKKYGRYHNESNTYNKSTKRSEYTIEWIADAETIITLSYRFPENSGGKNGFDITVFYVNDSIAKREKREAEQKERLKAEQEKKAREAARAYEKGASNF